MDYSLTGIELSSRSTLIPFVRLAEFLGNAEVDVQEVADNCRRSMSGSWKVTFPLLMANDSIPQDEASLTVSFAVTENSRGFTEEEIWQ